MVWPALPADTSCGRLEEFLHFGSNLIAHARGAHRALTAGDLGGPKASLEDLLNGSLDRVRFTLHAETVTEHQGRAGDGGDRVGAVSSGDIRSRPVHRFVESMMLSKARRRQEADRSGQHGGFVAEDVAKHVVRQD